MSVLTPGLQDALAAAVRSGKSDTAAAIAVGISPSTLHEWLAIDRDDRDTWHYGAPVTDEHKTAISLLSAALASARAEYEAALLERIDRAGQTVGRSGVLEWRADAWLLEHDPRFRERYGQVTQVQVTSDQRSLVIHQWAKAAPDHELLDAAPELAMLLPPQDETGGLSGDGGGADP